VGVGEGRPTRRSVCVLGGSQTQRGEGRTSPLLSTYWPQGPSCQGPRRYQRGTGLRDPPTDSQGVSSNWSNSTVQSPRDLPQADHRPPEHLGQQSHVSLGKGPSWEDLSTPWHQDRIHSGPLSSSKGVSVLVPWAEARIPQPSSGPPPLL
jgi:hypothetical protein